MRKMSGREHPSGAPKGKAKLEREEREKKLPKLTKYLLTAASPESYSCSIASAFQNPEITDSACVKDTSPSTLWFLGEQQHFTPLGCPDHERRTPTSPIPICVQPTSTESCPVSATGPNPCHRT